MHPIKAAFWVLTLSGTGCCAVAVFNLFLVDWGGISGNFKVNLGIVVVAGALAWFANVGLFGALPLAAAYELSRSPDRSVVMCAISTITAALTIFATGWFGLALAVVFGTALTLVLLSSRRPTVTSARSRRPLAKRSKRDSTAYVLLVGAGLVGAHNFYLQRAWAGVMSIGLLLVMVVSWGTFLFYMVACLVIFLLAWDAYEVPSRVRRLNQSL